MDHMVSTARDVPNPILQQATGKPNPNQQSNGKQPDAETPAQEAEPASTASAAVSAATKPSPASPATATVVDVTNRSVAEPTAAAAEPAAAAVVAVAIAATTSPPKSWYQLSSQLWSPAASLAAAVGLL